MDWNWRCIDPIASVDRGKIRLDVDRVAWRPINTIDINRCSVNGDYSIETGWRSHSVTINLFGLTYDSKAQPMAMYDEHIHALIALLKLAAISATNIIIEWLADHRLSTLQQDRLIAAVAHTPLVRRCMQLYCFRRMFVWWLAGRFRYGTTITHITHTQTISLWLCCSQIGQVAIFTADSMFIIAFWLFYEFCWWFCFSLLLFNVFLALQTFCMLDTNGSSCMECVVRWQGKNSNFSWFIGNPYSIRRYGTTSIILSVTYEYYVRREAEGTRWCVSCSCSSINGNKCLVFGLNGGIRSIEIDGDWL